MRAIEEIISMPDANNVHSFLTARKQGFPTPLRILQEQWNPKQHKVFDKDYRPDKTIKVPTGKTDPKTGKQIYKNKKVGVVRIAVPMQQSIVNLTVGFLLMNAVTYKATSHGVDAKKLNDKQQKLFDSITHCFSDNKMKYFDKRLARTVMSECEAAELWYQPTDTEGKLRGEIRVMLLSPSRGDKLYPHFNDYHRMDGFAREYYVYDELGGQELYFDVYTDRFCYQYVNKDGGWKLSSAKPHGFTKIPIVYYRQDEAEWEKVQWAIDRLETCISNWGDTNDYFGTPKYRPIFIKIYNDIQRYDFNRVISYLKNFEQTKKYIKVYLFILFYCS